MQNRALVWIVAAIVLIGVAYFVLAGGDDAALVEEPAAEAPASDAPASDAPAAEETAPSN